MPGRRDSANRRDGQSYGDVRSDVDAGNAVALCRSKCVGQKEHTALRRDSPPAECASEAAALGIDADRDQADAEQNESERRARRHASAQTVGERTEDLAIDVQIDADAVLRQ